jgi:hypothetical protein
MFEMGLQTDGRWWQAVDEDEDEDMQQQSPQSPDDLDDDGDEHMEHTGQRDETSQLIKNLLRYALACEYSRTPIRRDGIKEKGTYREKLVPLGRPLTPLSAWCEWARIQEGVCWRTEAITGHVWHGDGRAAYQR